LRTHRRTAGNGPGNPRDIGTDHFPLSIRMAQPMRCSAFETVNEFFNFDAISLHRDAA
jgi:hypothetical protein